MKFSWSESAFLTLDLEGSGDRASENPILEIGAVIKLPDGKTIAEFHELGVCKEDQYEKRCVLEFWDKVDKDGKKRKRYTEAQDSYRLWKNFYDWIVKNTKDRKKIYIVSDNPSYDCGVASYNFDRYFSGKSMHYVMGNGYTNIRDMHSAVESLAMLCGMKRSVFVAKILETYHKAHPHVIPAEHDHDPLNDANSIANTWLAMIYFLKQNERN